MKTAITTIALSGHVYIAKLHFDHHPEWELPGNVQLGDIRLLTVPNQVAIPGNHETVGFISASIFDGKNWRRLMLRAAAQGSATYNNTEQRLIRLKEIIGTLKKLGGQSALKMKGGYIVPETKLTRTTVPTGTLQIKPDAQDIVQPELSREHLIQLPLL